MFINRGHHPLSTTLSGASCIFGQVPRVAPGAQVGAKSLRCVGDFDLVCGCRQRFTFAGVLPLPADRTFRFGVHHAAFQNPHRIANSIVYWSWRELSPCERDLSRGHCGKFIRRRMASNPGSLCRESKTGSALTLAIPPDRLAKAFSSQATASPFLPNNE